MSHDHGRSNGSNARPDRSHQPGKHRRTGIHQDWHGESGTRLYRDAAPLIAKTHYNKVFVGPAGGFPNKKFWMGTDLNSRDQFSCIVYGVRVSLAGINPPTSSWGQMLGRDGVANTNYFWHLAFFPAIMIAIAMLGFTLMGDGLRDALDPRMLREK
ncbi:MAG: hypothetical protein JSV36_19565 [Anaerolineae bacterium]|nr:MAG: hypothetical protein JSV36_19565 [Anaerolineae bacterium]